MPLKARTAQWVSETGGGAGNLPRLEQLASSWFMSQSREIIDGAQYGSFDKDDLISTNTVVFHYDKLLQRLLAPGASEIRGTAALTGEGGKYRFTYAARLAGPRPVIENGFLSPSVVEQTPHHLTMEFGTSYSGRQGLAAGAVTVTLLPQPPLPMSADNPVFILESRPLETTSVTGITQTRIGESASRTRLKVSYQGWRARDTSSLLLVMKDKNGALIGSRAVQMPKRWEPLASLQTVLAVTKGSADLNVRIRTTQSGERGPRLALTAKILSTSGTPPPMGSPGFGDATLSVEQGIRDYTLRFPYVNGIASGARLLRVKITDTATGRIVYQDDEAITVP